MDVDEDAQIFSSWPKISINCNDSEMELFSKYFDIVDKNTIVIQMRNIMDEGHVKDKTAADLFRAQGNDLYKENDYGAALTLYSKSILAAPRDSTEFGLAVANRSAVLYDLKKYKECLEDIHLALRSEYPKDLYYKLYLRQHYCYLHTNNNYEAANALRKAEENVKLMSSTKTGISIINNKITEAKNLLREQLEKDPSENDSNTDNILFETTLKDGENCKFLNAAKVVDMKYTKKLGRHVVANIDIKKGDILFIEKPYSFVALKHIATIYHTCSFCLREIFNCVPCTECTVFLYCSDNCRKSAWDLHHRWMCFGEKTNILRSTGQQLSLVTLFQASHDGFRTVVEDDSYYGNKDNNYPFFNKLATKKNLADTQVLLKYMQYAVWLVLYLKNYTNYFDWLYITPNRPEGSRTDLDTFVGGLLFKYLLQFQYNAIFTTKGHIIGDENNISIEIINSGTGIFVSTSLLNHSCVPNTISSFQGTKRIVKALKDIKKGKEITINYIPPKYDSLISEKRKLVLKKMLITCSCEACSDSSYITSRQPLLCPRCQGKAFPMENILTAKCSECSIIYVAADALMNKPRIAELFAQFYRTSDTIVLDTIFKLLNSIYHKENINFIPYYEACLKLYVETGEIKKIIESTKSILELQENVIAELTYEQLVCLLMHTCALAKYYKQVKTQNSQISMKYYHETKAMINKCKEIISYYFGNVNSMIKDLLKILNLDDIQMDV